VVTEAWRHQNRRRTATQAATENPTLAAGELLVETDTFGVKTGDGATAYNSLPYVTPYRGDLTMQAAVSGDGYATATNGSIRRTQHIMVPWTYTSTAPPTDVAVGTAFHVPVAVTVNNTGGGFGPLFQTGHFGPRGIVNIEGIARYQQNMTTIAFAPVGHGDFLTIANNAGAARTLVPAWTYLSARSVIADGATCTLDNNDTADGGAAFSDTACYLSVNSGTLDGVTNGSEIISYHSAPALSGNTDITRRVAFDARAVIKNVGVIAAGQPHWDIPGSTIDADSVSLTEEIGLRVQPFTIGATKIGISTAHPIRLMDTDISHAGTLALIDTPTTRTLTLGTSPAIKAVEFSPTVVFEDDTTAFGVGQMFNANPIYKNATGEARSLGSVIGFFGVNMQPRFRADNAAVSMASAIGFRANILVDRLGSGAFTLTSLVDFQSAPSVDTGNTATTRKGAEINDVAGAGTVTTNIGVDIAALTRGATNIGIRNAATRVETPTTQNITAATQAIVANATVKALTVSTVSNPTMTAAPTIADGVDGQIIELLNVDTVDTITLQDQGTLANSNLRLSATTVVLGPRDSLRLRYSATVGDWVQIGQVNVL
jgi:Major tropism determinant N-terminal domain